jgi:Trypsin-co-occurring domain 2
MEIGLVDLIATLKKEFQDLQQLPGPKMLSMTTVELEIKFTVQKNIEAGAKAKWLLLAAEAKGSYKNENVHTIKLSFEPNESWGRIVAQLDEDEARPRPGDRLEA